MKGIRNTLHTAAERAHLEALGAARRAIRAGDLKTAKEWLALSERHYRNSEHAYRDWALAREKLRKRQLRG